MSDFRGVAGVIINYESVMFSRHLEGYDTLRMGGGAFRGVAEYGPLICIWVYEVVIKYELVIVESTLFLFLVFRWNRFNWHRSIEICGIVDDTCRCEAAC